MGDNGKLEKEEPKSEAQLEKERLERYQKNPYSFVEMSDIVLCAIRNEAGGVAIYIGNVRRTEIGIALTELNHSVFKKLISMDVQQQIQNKDIILPSKGGLLNFARKLRR
jgi:molybdopterin synthase catalytic subunit